MENHTIIQVEDKAPFRLLIPLSIQHMFAMFGASVLVPFLFGINPAVVLFMNGRGHSAFYSGHQGKGSGLSGLQLRLSGSCRHRHRQLGL